MGTRTSKRTDNIDQHLRWGGHGTEDGLFQYPRGIVIDPNNQIYIADCVNSRIQIFNYEGKFINKWLLNDSQLPNRPIGLAINNRTNRMYISCFQNNEILVLQADDGKFITKWGTKGKANGQFDRIGHLAVNEDDNLVYVVDGRNFRIQVFDGLGHYQKQYTHLRPKLRLTPDDIVYKNNTLYFTDRQTFNVWMIQSDETIHCWTCFGKQERFGQRLGICIDNLNCVYVSNFQRNTIQVFDLNGVFIKQWTCDYEDHLERQVKISKITCLHQGNLYFVDSSDKIHQHSFFC